MSEPGDPTRTAAPAPDSPADTRPGGGNPSDAPPTGSFHAPQTPYSDLVPHARGGLGEVFSATDGALNRTVAVKRLQDHRASDAECRRRFLVEAEVTARLEHPGVVPVYTLFTDDRGSPAYAMRFVQGPTLWDALKEYHAGPPDPVAFRRLLQSFIQVCQTVAYAHSRGVIHRDLKPQNILLGRFGETLVVDWGLAKVVGRPEEVRVEPVAEGTLVPGSGGSGSETAMGSAVGTPAYMSPEQAAGRWDVIARSSDVYSLGAVLHTILTGKPPLEKANWPEMQQKIQRGDFPRPREVKPDLPRALEAVCLKAMALEPELRYPSAEAVAADVEHWLADEPVSAYREPFAARTRRWMRGHRTLVSAAVVLLVAAVAGLSVGAALLGRKNQEIDRERQAAVTARRKAEAINRFLIDDVLKQADPVNNPAGEKLTVVQLLDKAAARLNRQTNLADEPEVELELRLVIGHAYEYLGRPETAGPHYTRALELGTRLAGPDHPDTLVALNRVTWAAANQGDIPRAEPLAVDAFDRCLRVLGEADAETAVAANNLAEVRIQQNRFDEGVALRRRASAMAHAGAGPDDNRTLEIDTDLGVALVRAGHPAEAEPIVRSVVDRRRRLTPNHPEFSKALSNLGGIDLALGNFPAAEPVLSEALDAGRRIDGEESATTLATLNLRCYALEGLERWDEAGKLYPRVLDGRRRLKGGEGQAGVQKTLAFMSRFYAKQQRWQDSARCLAELVLSLHRDPNRRPEALAGTIAAALGGEGDPKAAEPLLRECRDAVDSRLWPGDWFRVEIASRYGECLRRQGKFDEAKPVLEAAANDARQAVGVPAWGVPAARKRVADLYEAWKKPDEAAKWK